MHSLFVLVMPFICIGLVSAFWIGYTVCWEGTRKDTAQQGVGVANGSPSHGNENSRVKAGKASYRSSLATRNIVSALVLGMTFLPAITRLTFSFFKCSTIVVSRSFVLADMNVQCGSLHHQHVLLWLGGPALILYVLGIPVCAFGFLYLRRGQLKMSLTQEQAGFLYSDYELTHYCKSRLERSELQS